MPLTQAAPGESRNAITGAMSSGSASRPASAVAASMAASPIEARKSGRIGVSTTPGLTDTTRTPRWRQATDACSVHSISTCMENR